MNKLPPLTKKRRSLADLSPDSLAAALYHREFVGATIDSPKAQQSQQQEFEQKKELIKPKH